MNKLGLYFHIPFCRSRCDYCGFYSIGMKPDDRFIHALSLEIQRRSAFFKDRIVDTIYLGGGTPSTLTSSQLEKLFKEIRTNFRIAEDAEITMELNPCDMTKEYMESVRQVGVNRISVGVQSHQDFLLKKIGRLHNAKEAEKAIRSAYQMGFHNISVDLMYELPGQSVSDFEESLKWAVHLPISHISVYSLIIEERTRFQQLYEKGILERPSEEESWAMYQAMCRFLPHYGFERYEVSSFARNGKRSSHNKKYWELDDYLGMGPGASSRIGHERFTNVPGVRLYERELILGNLPKMEVEDLSKEEEIEEYCFLHLRMKEGIAMSKYKERFGEEITKRYGAKIEFLKKKKLLQEEGDFLSLTYKGFALGNYVFEQFLLT